MKRGILEGEDGAAEGVNSEGFEGITGTSETMTSLGVSFVSVSEFAVVVDKVVDTVGITVEC